MSVAWTDIELAIRTWISTGAEIALNRVLPWPLNGPRPDEPYASVKFGPTTRVGRDWKTAEANPIPSPGEEILTRVSGVRKIVVSIQAWDPNTIGSNAARARLERLVTNSRFRQMREILSPSNVSLIDFGSVMSLSEVINQTTQDPRAALDVTFHVPSTATMPDMPIKTVEAEIEVST